MSISWKRSLRWRAALWFYNVCRNGLCRTSSWQRDILSDYCKHIAMARIQHRRAEYIYTISPYTGCCLNGRTAQPPSKSLIFWSFPNVLCLFDSSIWAIFIQVFLGHRIEKKTEKSHLQKRLGFRGGSKWLIFCPTEYWGLPIWGSIISDISPSILEILVLILLQIP